MKSPTPVAGELLSSMQAWNSTVLLSGVSTSRAAAVQSPNVLASEVLSALMKSE